MKITLEPTPELFEAPINGRAVPMSIWRGHTDSGLLIEAYILSITPDDPFCWEMLRMELPEFMVGSRRISLPGDSPKEPTPGGESQP